ncbi:hypothetical protein QQF64_022507, partial [Cirrhinus molitorella]
MQELCVIACCCIESRPLFSDLRPALVLNMGSFRAEGRSVSLSVLLVSLAVTVCGVWLVALCGVCGWCQRKL